MSAKAAKSEEDLQLSRCPTGVPGFDEVTEGGLVRGTLTLLAGNPGTGKTLFAARFIYTGATKWNEPGVYVSFAEPRKRFYEFMRQFDMDFESLEAKGLFSFIQIPTAISREAVATLTDNIFKTVMRIGAKRLVIDSITPLMHILGPIETRAMLHNAIYNLALLFNVTSILIADLPIGEQRIGYSVEEFIADTVIILKLDYSKPGSYRRYMNIIKMRGTSLAEVSLEYSIMPKLGLVVHTPLSLGRTYISRSERINTYIEGLDNLLGGGIIKGSSTLIIGPSGSGKTLLTLSIAAENVKHGNNVLYISFDEPVSQLAETLSLLGYNHQQLEATGLKMVYVDPYTVTPGKLRHLMKDLVMGKGFGKDLVIIDGLSALYRILDEEEFTRVSEELVLLFKNEGISLIMNMARDYFQEGGLLETIADNILVLRINPGSTQVRRELIILKSRMNIVDNRWHELALEEGRLKVI